MKTSKAIWVVIMATILALSAAEGTTDFYVDGIIQEGDSYDDVFVWNEAVVDMTGGTIQSLDTLNTSAFSLHAGNITEGVSVWNGSTFDMFGGVVGWYLEVVDSATANLHGGEITDWLYAADSSVVNVYGYDFNYDPLAGSWNGGQLTGLWEDGSPFSIDFLDNIEMGSTYDDHIILIPEPATLLLLGFGAVMLRRKHRA